MATTLLFFSAPIAWLQVPLLVITMSSFLPAQSLVDEAAASAPTEFVNSLEMIFRPLPGAPVLMSVWETRVADWEVFVRESSFEWKHPPAFSQTPQHPVVNITLADAKAFCDWLTRHERTKGLLKEGQAYRLPVQEEWDVAVEAMKTADAPSATADPLLQKYPWGNDWPPLRQAGNYNSKRITGGRDDGFEYTAPVGQFAPSKEGFYDLGGNVWEWVTEQAGKPGGLESLRGGSWLYWRPECLEAGYRMVVKGDTRAPTIGFRCVLDDLEKSKAYLEKLRQVAAAGRSTLLSKPRAESEDVERMKREMQAAPSEPADNAARARLLNKPTVTAEEIEQVLNSRLKSSPATAPGEKSEKPAPLSPSKN